MASKKKTMALNQDSQIIVFPFFLLFFFFVCVLPSALKPDILADTTTFTADCSGIGSMRLDAKDPDR